MSMINVTASAVIDAAPEAIYAVFSDYHVTIASKFNRSPGFAGFMEQLMTPPITRRIYKKELANLAAYVKEQEKGVAEAQ